MHFVFQAYNSMQSYLLPCLAVKALSIKTRHYILPLTPEQEQLLDYYQQEPAKFWNYILDVPRTWYEASHGKGIGENGPQKRFKDRFDLHSHTVPDKCIVSRQTVASLRRICNWKTWYPYRNKKYLTIQYEKIDSFHKTVE